VVVKSQHACTQVDTPDFPLPHIITQALVQGHPNISSLPLKSS
jgi:hypothetical protein